MGGSGGGECWKNVDQVDCCLHFLWSRDDKETTYTSNSKYFWNVSEKMKLIADVNAYNPSIFVFKTTAISWLESHFKIHFSFVKMSSADFLSNLERWPASRIAGLLDWKLGSGKTVRIQFWVTSSFEICFQSDLTITWGVQLAQEMNKLQFPG